MLPARRKPIRFGTERRPKRKWPRHEKFVRSDECCIAGRNGHECHGRIILAHVRTGTDGGEGIKPSAWWTISLCDDAHMLQHALGEPGFERRFGIDMKALAREFAARSPDFKMKAAMREEGL